mmetsp:Transcript_58021/g.188849  ORF Transcript_58021/g.188849 Transcript_58021/m.188849 type:complete len:139 (+) Transcript_58021:339-755(+)
MPQRWRSPRSRSCSRSSRWSWTSSLRSWTPRLLVPLQLSMRCASGASKSVWALAFPTTSSKVMVTAAMERCGVTDPRRVVKVGDTVVDVEEGRNAGVFTVSVLTGTQSRDKLAAAGPDCIIPSVADLPLVFQWPQSST